MREIRTLRLTWRGLETWPRWNCEPIPQSKERSWKPSTYSRRAFPRPYLTGGLGKRTPGQRALILPTLFWRRPPARPGPAVRAFGWCWTGAAACGRVEPLGCWAWESSRPEEEQCDDAYRCTSERRKPNPMLAHGSRRHEAAPACGRRMTQIHRIATLSVGQRRREESANQTLMRNSRSFLY